MFPGSYFPARYFGARYWSKTGDLSGLYTNAGDIKTRIIGAYLNNGDIESFLGIEFGKTGDVYALVLKRAPQQRVYFTFDIQSQLN